MTAPLRLGLIGAGRWGRNYIKTISSLDGVRLAALASTNPQSAKLVPPNCDICPDWRAIVDPRRIDALIVATPPALHATMAAAAIEAGLPVLVEKPLTLDLDEALMLRKLVATRGDLVFVMVGHTHLFSPAYRKLRQMAVACGPIRAMRSEAGNHGPFRPDTAVLWDWGAHDVAMCLDLVHSSAEGASARRLESRNVEGTTAEILELDLSFPGGVRAHVRIGNLLPKRRWFAAYFDKAVLVYDDLAPDKLVLHPPVADYGLPQGAGQAVAIAAEFPLSNVVGNFAQMVRAGSRDLSTLDLGIEVVRTLSRCAALLSA